MKDGAAIVATSGRSGGIGNKNLGHKDKFFSRKILSLNLNYITDIYVREKPDGSGIIIFEEPHYSGSLTVPWPAVSCAMALATGHRQAEIHCTATFKPSSDYEVLFCPRGDRPFAQTKTRPGSEAHKEWLENPIRAIPTLLPASLVLAGDKFLEKGYKVNHENQVNSNFNAKLRSHMHSFAPGFQYKNLRDFYAVASLRNWLHEGLPEGSLNQRIKQALGHGLLGDATPSYMKFSLTPESISKI